MNGAEIELKATISIKCVCCEVTGGEYRNLGACLSETYRNGWDHSIRNGYELWSICGDCQSNPETNV